MIDNVSDFLEKKMEIWKNMEYLPSIFPLLLKEFYPKDFSEIKSIASTTSKDQYVAGKSLFTRNDFYYEKKLKPAVDFFKKYMSFMENSQEADLKNSKEGIKILKQFKIKEIEELLTAYLEQNMSYFEAKAAQMPTAPLLTYFLAYFSMLPFALNFQKSIEKQHSLEIWQHGYCPYCGSPAYISYLLGKEGKRFHACSFCHSIYHVPRLQCPYCLEKDQEKLVYFTSSTDPKFQVCGCKTCNNYIKLADLREQEKQIPFPLSDDMESLTLDILAEKKGFHTYFIPLWI